MTDTIQLKLTIPEMNLALEALSSMPYFKVYELIGKMQMAAQQQLSENDKQRPTQTQDTQTSVPAPTNGVHAVV